MIRSIVKSIVAVAFVAVPFVAACDVDPDNSDQAITGDPKEDCQAVCDRMDECAIEGEDDFDAAACSASCESEADGSDNFASDVTECHTCVDKEFGFGDDDTCATDFAVCGNECANVIAQSN